MALLPRIDDLQGLELFAFIQLLNVELCCFYDVESCQHLFLYLEMLRPTLFPLFLPVLQLYTNELVQICLCSNTILDETSISKDFLEIICKRVDILDHLNVILKPFHDLEIEHRVEDQGIEAVLEKRLQATKSNLRLILANIESISFLKQLTTGSEVLEKFKLPIDST